MKRYGYLGAVVCGICGLFYGINAVRVGESLMLWGYLAMFAGFALLAAGVVQDYEDTSN
jgi:hypothetical protein